MHRWSHHLNLWVRDYFGSGALGDFHIRDCAFTPIFFVKP
jgi:hypothetical protein